MIEKNLNKDQKKCHVAYFAKIMLRFFNITINMFYHLKSLKVGLFFSTKLILNEKICFYESLATFMDDLKRGMG